MLVKNKTLVQGTITETREKFERFIDNNGQRDDSSGFFQRRRRTELERRGKWLLSEVGMNKTFCEMDGDGSLVLTDAVGGPFQGTVSISTEVKGWQVVVNVGVVIVSTTPGWSCGMLEGFTCR